MDIGRGEERVRCMERIKWILILPYVKWASLVAQMVKHPPTMRETRVQSLGWEDLLEKEMATHSSILAWKIPWKEEPGRLQSMGSQRVGHDWATSLSLILLYTYITICKIDSQWEFAVWLRKLKQGLCINLEGWDGEGDGRGSRGRGYIYIYLWELMLLNCGVGEDSWESLGQQGNPTSPS